MVNHQLNRSKWSEKDRAQLKELSKRFTDQEIARYLNRTVTAVSSQRKLLGIKKSTRPFIQIKWSPAEIEQLKEMVTLYPEAEIAEKLHRSVGSIRGQKNLLGLTSGFGWQDAEIEHLKQAVSAGKSNQEIAQKLGRTRSSIRQMKERLGLGDFSVRKWTEEEVQELRVLAHEMTTAELANHFHREWTAVERKCKSLGINTQSKQVEIIGPYTAEDENYIIQVSEYLTPAQIAEKLGRSEGSIKSHRTRMRRKGIDVPYYAKRTLK